MLYSSVDNNKIKDLKKLQTKKYRDKKNILRQLAQANNREFKKLLYDKVLFY